MANHQDKAGSELKRFIEPKIMIMFKWLTFADLCVLKFSGQPPEDYDNMIEPSIHKVVPTTKSEQGCNKI